MGIYGWAFGDINPHKSQDWIYEKSIHLHAAQLE